jgi:hypothetical protein
MESDTDADVVKLGFLRSISARAAAYSGLLMYFNWQPGAIWIQFSGVVIVSCLIWNIIVITDAETRGGEADV